MTHIKAAAPRRSRQHWGRSGTRSLGNPHISSRCFAVPEEAAPGASPACPTASAFFFAPEIAKTPCTESWFREPMLGLCSEHTVLLPLPGGSRKASGSCRSTRLTGSVLVPDLAEQWQGESGSRTWGHANLWLLPFRHICVFVLPGSDYLAALVLVFALTSVAVLVGRCGSRSSRRRAAGLLAPQADVDVHQKRQLLQSQPAVVGSLQRREAGGSPAGAAGPDPARPCGAAAGGAAHEAAGWLRVPNVWLGLLGR